MAIKKILIIFFFFFTNDLFSNEYKIIVSVNNKPITELDILEEIEILKILNKNINIDFNKVKNIALQNLIDEELKILEIKKSNINASEKAIDQSLSIFLKQMNKNEINNNFIRKIREKIKIDYMWNNLINIQYGWKTNINILEIEKKILDNNPSLSKEKRDEIKNEMINLEKNKKLQVFSNYHLNKIKKEYLIKFY